MGDRSERALRHLLWHPKADERGAAIVELAIVVPLLFALIFGMFSGGLAYNRKLTLTNAVREGSRYGATLAVAQARTQPTPACTLASDMQCWLDQVADITQQAAEGELGSSASAREICVAYVHPDGVTASADDKNHKLLRTFSAPDAFSTDPGSATPANTCFLDGRPDGERRVQVTAQRDGKLEYLVSSSNLTLSSKSVTRFEALG